MVTQFFIQWRLILKMENILRTVSIAKFYKYENCFFSLILICDFAVARIRTIQADAMRRQ